MRDCPCIVLCSLHTIRRSCQRPGNRQVLNLCWSALGLAADVGNMGTCTGHAIEQHYRFECKPSVIWTCNIWYSLMCKLAQKSTFQLVSMATGPANISVGAQELCARTSACVRRTWYSWFKVNIARMSLCGRPALARSLQRWFSGPLP